MRIDQDYRNVNQSVDNGTNTISHGNVSTSRSDGTRIFAIDISGTVMDNNAYGGHGKTTEDVMQEAGQINIAQQKDYMTVMSNAMSEEDFAKLQEEGYHPGSTDIETMVTVVDRIKAELVKAGVQVEGYTDTLDQDTLTAITGDSAQALCIAQKLKENNVPVTKENMEASKKALDKASELSSLSDGAMKYMIQNHMTPTIDHVYTAEYSAMGDGNQQAKGFYADNTQGYYAKKADTVDMNQLMPQVEKIIQNAGFSVQEDKIEDAKWLIEKGIPLTEDALQGFVALKEVDFGSVQDIDIMMDSIAQAIGEGRKAGDAALNQGASIYEQASALVDLVNEISDQAIAQVVEQGQTIHLRNLSEAQKRIQGTEISPQADTATDQTYNISGEEKIVTTKSQLEEIRLQMTLEANVKLLRAGIQIDTRELQDLVGTYRALEEQRNINIPTLYEETLEKLASIPSMPAAVIGQAVTEGDTFTLQYVHEKGTVLQQAYESAGETYEALMTAPRRDLGDSIQKAFRNVDDLLEDIQMEANESNRRAVRILGYNQMEVSREHVEAVIEADESLRQVVSKMTPAATLQMIRDGMNPLKTDMNTMEEYLSELDSDLLNETEKYSRYLYKLEQNSEITQEEREAYVGIYRLLRQVEKSDGAAIGAVVNQGSELSFQNLLSAVRTRKKTGMDVSVDDAFGGMDSKMINGKSISDQINTMNQLSNNTNATNANNMLLSAKRIARNVQDQLVEMDESMEKDYQLLQLQEFRQINQIDESVVQSLLDYNQPVTIDNLLAANALQQNKGGAYRKLFGEAEDVAKATNEVNVIDHGEDASGNSKGLDALTSVVREIQNSFAGNNTIAEQGEISPREAVTSAYDNLQAEAGKLLQSKMDDTSVTSIDLKSAALTFKQISLITNLSKEENYEVPVKIGNEITSINLRIIRGSENSKVAATTQTELYGKVAAEFTVTKSTVSGYLATDSREGYQELKNVEQKLRDQIQTATRAAEQKEVQSGSSTEESTEKQVTIQIMHSEKLNMNKYQEKSTHISENEKVSSKELYSIGKSIISTLQTEEFDR